MRKRRLEMCVESVDCAVVAERGGAHRIELCSNLAVGGLTPVPEMMRTTRRCVSVPIFVMIRPRAGDFRYTVAEFDSMHHQIATAKQLGMDGIVLGILDPQNRIDVERTRVLVDQARPLPVTFHRAFDESFDPERGLESVIQAGAQRILTSGGREDATSGVRALSELIRKAAGRVTIMPGGGVNENNVAHILRLTSAREVHSSLGGFEAAAILERRRTAQFTEAAVNRDWDTFQQRVRKLVDAIESLDKDSESGFTGDHADPNWNGGS